MTFRELRTFILVVLGVVLALGLAGVASQRPPYFVLGLLGIIGVAGLAALMGPGALGVAVATKRARLLGASPTRRRQTLAFLAVTGLVLIAVPIVVLLEEALTIPGYLGSRHRGVHGETVWFLFLGSLVYLLFWLGLKVASAIVIGPRSRFHGPVRHGVESSITTSRLMIVIALITFLIWLGVSRGGSGACALGVLIGTSTLFPLLIVGARRDQRVKAGLATPLAWWVRGLAPTLLHYFALGGLAATLVYYLETV